jgi:hypothetical protein
MHYAPDCFKPPTNYAGAAAETDQGCIVLGGNVELVCFRFICPSVT